MEALPGDHPSGVWDVAPRFGSLHVGFDYVIDGATLHDAIQLQSMVTTQAKASKVLGSPL